MIGADLMMPLTDPDDRATAAVFADGAGAVLMRGTLESRVGPIVLRSDGTRADLIRIDREDLIIRMQGHETFKYAVDLMSGSTIEAVGKAGLELDDVDLFVYHQANARILRAVGERLGLDPGPGDRLDRQARQHLGGDDPAGARPGEAPRRLRERLARPARRLRRRAQLGRHRDRVGRGGERRCLSARRAAPW